MSTLRPRTSTVQYYFGMDTAPDAPRLRGRPGGSSGADLLAIARDLLLDRGYAGTTMDAVAAGARISKQTLYRQYPSKDDLYAAVVRDWVDRGRDAMRPHLDALIATDDAGRGLRALAGTLQAGVLSGPVLRMRTLVAAEAQRFPGPPAEQTTAEQAKADPAKAGPVETAAAAAPQARPANENAPQAAAPEAPASPAPEPVAPERARQIADWAANRSDHSGGFLGFGGTDFALFQPFGNGIQDGDGGQYQDGGCTKQVFEQAFHDISPIVKCFLKRW